jgi:effector-binding domain-containing protein
MAYDISIKEIKPQRFAGVRAKTTINKVTEKVTQLLGETADYLESQGVKPTGPGFGVYYEVGAVVVDVEVGYPIDGEIEGNDRVHSGELPGVKAAVAIYEGPHTEMPDAHRAVHMWMHENDVKAAEDPAREVYLTDLRDLKAGEDCKAESVWPVMVPPTRAERRRAATK